MPGREHRERGERERYGVRLDGERLRESLGQAFGDGGDEIGRRDGVPQPREVRQTHRDATRPPALGERPIDVARLLVLGDEDVVEAGIRGEPQARGDVRVPSSRQTHEALSMEAPGAQRSGGHLLRAPHQHIDLTRGEGREGGRARGTNHQIDVRRTCGQEREQARQRGDLKEVAHPDAEATRRAEWVEGLPGIEHLLELGEASPDPLPERLAERREQPAPKEERIVEEHPQLREAVAHRGLAEPRAPSGRGHGALREEGIERNEEVEVDRADIHAVNGRMKNIDGLDGAAGRIVPA